MVAHTKEDQMLSWKSINFRCSVHITRGNHADYTEELNVVSITERAIQIYRIVRFHNAKKLVRPILVRRQYKSVRNATCEGFVQIRQDFPLAFLFLFQVHLLKFNRRGSIRYQLLGRKQKPMRIEKLYKVYQKTVNINSFAKVNCKQNNNY